MSERGQRELFSMNNNDTRQIALSILEGLRDDILTARTRDGHRILDTADFRQYLTEQINHIRGNSHSEEYSDSSPDQLKRP